MERRRQARRQVMQAGALIGAGTAALLHGILFRQLLGWHHVLDTADDPRLAEISDGIVAAFALLLLIWGVTRLVAARGRLNTPRVPRRLGGAALVGAGAFQLIEGITLHHVAQIHRVNPSGNVLAWDLIYLFVGLMLAAIGGLMLQGVAREVRRMEEVPPHAEHRRRPGLAR